MIFANCKFAIIPSRFDTFKIFFCKLLKFFYCVFDGTNVTYLTPHNKFRRSDVSQTCNFFTSRQSWCW